MIFLVTLNIGHILLKIASNERTNERGRKMDIPSQKSLIQNLGQSKIIFCQRRWLARWLAQKLHLAKIDLFHYF